MFCGALYAANGAHLTKLQFFCSLETLRRQFSLQICMSKLSQTNFLLQVNLVIAMIILAGQINFTFKCGYRWGAKTISEVQVKTFMHLSATLLT